MGLFDALSGRKEISLTPKAGMLLAAITMTAADGSIDDEEIDIIRRLDRRDDGSWDQAVKAWKQKSFEECVSIATEALDSRQRLVTLANLVDIAMADGFLAGREKDLLEEYVRLFDINDDQVQSIVSVIGIKNDESAFE